MADPILEDLDSSVMISDEKAPRVEEMGDLYVLGVCAPGEEPGSETPKRGVMIKGDGWKATFKFEGDEVDRLIQKIKNPREAER